jgi:hypothetical protein
MGAPRVSSGTTGPPVTICASRAKFWCLVLALASLGSPAGLPLQLGTPEDELKSAIILSFLRYSEWPDRAAPDQPLTVGVLGRPGLVSVLRRTLEGKPVNNRTVRVLELKSLSDPHCCQVLYVATEKPAEIRPALASAHSSPLLTIGEVDRFLEYGGAVNLMVVDGHMAFEVDLKAVERTGVSISSKLLRYGQVRGRPPA